jgi:hypothetical protein
MRTVFTAVGTLLVLTAAGWTRSADAPEPNRPQQQSTAKSTAPAPKPEDLDKLLAPIALYPDQLLAQMLLCSANPAKVAALNEWLASQTLAGTDLQDAATKAGFGASFVALALFPDIVQRMSEQFEWTSRIGQAFTADSKAVFASIQRLRAKAQSVGTLKTTPQQEVETRKTSSGETVIVIEPANPQIVYVPQYNATTVYTQAPTTTVVVQQQSSSSADAVAAGLIGFTAGIALGAAIDNDHYYGPYGWGGGFYMYNDAWDDWYDHREDAREDWMDHREDMYENRSDRAEDVREQRGERTQNAQEQRTERTQTRQENRPAATDAQREQARASAQSATQARTSTQSAATTQNRTSQESRGYTRDGSQATKERSGTKSDAFSNYSSGRSERAASDRGQRSKSRSSGGGSRRR